MARVAQQNQVGDVGFTFVEPVLSMMPLSPDRRDSASRPSTSTSHASGEDLVVAKHSLSAAKKERNTGLVKDRRDDFCITEILQHGGRGDRTRLKAVGNIRMPTRCSSFSYVRKVRLIRGFVYTGHVLKWIH